jgi:hypothetical protein
MAFLDRLTIPVCNIEVDSNTFAGYQSSILDLVGSLALASAALQ